MKTIPAFSTLLVLSVSLAVAPAASALPLPCAADIYTGDHDAGVACPGVPHQPSVVYNEGGWYDGGDTFVTVCAAGGCVTQRCDTYDEHGAWVFCATPAGVTGAAYDEDGLSEHVRACAAGLCLQQCVNVEVWLYIEQPGARLCPTHWGPSLVDF